MGKRKPAVVLPLDGSKTATSALGAAQAVTEILGGVLYIVHIAGSQIPEDQLKEHLQISGMDLCSCLIEQITGEPVEAILAFASKVDAKMIVMASHGFTYNDTRLIGSITMGVIQEAKSPVMIVRSDMENIPDSNWRPARLLCPLDGSPMASAQMQQIFDLAKLLGAEVDILNVVVQGEGSTEAGTITRSQYEDYPQHDVPAWVDEFVRRCCEVRPPEVELSMFQHAGEPVKTMVEFSREHKNELVVLTWHGQLEADRARTVKGLLKQTKVPVLLTRTTPR